MLQNFGVPAGGRQISAQASYFRLESVEAFGGNESVKVRADGQDLGEYLPGDSIRLPGGMTAAVWEVVPVNPLAKAVARLGVGGVESSRVFGSVKVIDSGHEKTRGGAQFMHTVTSVAGPGVVSVCGVVANGGKTCVVKRMQVASSAGGIVQVFRTNGQGSANASFSSMANKMLYSGNSESQLVVGSTLGGAPSAGEVPAWNYWLTFYVPPNQQMEVPLSTPVVMSGGVGLLVSGWVVNRDVSVLLDVEEL